MQARDALAEKYGSGHTVAPWVMEEVMDTGEANKKIKDKVFEL